MVKSKEEICVSLSARLPLLSFPPDTPDTEICVYNNMISKKAHFVDSREKYVPVGRLHDVICDLELGLHRALQLLLLNRAEQEEPAQ